MVQWSKPAQQPVLYSSVLFLTKILCSSLTCSFVFRYMTPATLLRFRRVCQSAHLAVGAYISFAFDINRQLCRFFQRPAEFRSLQAQTGTLISGSTALQFFNRCEYKGSDLDIYAHMAHRYDVGAWLLKQGYRFTPSKTQLHTFRAAQHLHFVTGNKGPYFMRGVAAVFNFIKKTKDGSGELKVQLIVATRTPMEIVLYFHSTCVMNVISYEKAYSLYPRATFEERRSLICPTDGSRQMKAIKKYAERGWRMVREFDGSDNAFRLGMRWVGDSSTWTISLDETGINPSTSVDTCSVPLSHDPVVVSSWHLGRAKGGGEMGFLIATTAEQLFYQYVISDEPLRRLIMWHMHWRTDGQRYFDETLIKMSSTLLHARIARMAMQSSAS